MAGSLRLVGSGPAGFWATGSPPIARPCPSLPVLEERIVGEGTGGKGPSDARRQAGDGREGAIVQTPDARRQSRPLWALVYS